MVFPSNLLLPDSMFSTYFKVMTYVTILTPWIHTVIPRRVQNYVVSYIKSYIEYLFGSYSPSSTLTLIINENGNGTNRYMVPGMVGNELFSTAQIYLSSKISPDASNLTMTKDPSNKKVNLGPCSEAVVSDIYKGIELTWRYSETKEEDEGYITKSGRIELSFDKKHKDLVMNSYVPYVEKEAHRITNEKRILKMYSYTQSRWAGLNFEHPSTFDTMAMTDELKRSVMGDLDRFIKRKDFYKRVGKAWKRGYLLYGPPGTGKSSLVAAMANYLKFDIYDLQLASVHGDAFLRTILLGIQNRSILVVEDIDCSLDLPTRLKPASTTAGAPKGSTKLTLSGLLNCIDGLWSSCGEERIIIFTTNNRDNLDPALIRPGRMDMHIYMGHCSFEGFKILASNYLCLSDIGDDTHRLYPEIKQLIEGEVLTPAQVAEILMKDEDADGVLDDLVEALRKKRSEPEKSDDECNEAARRIEDNEELVEDEDMAKRIKAEEEKLIEDEVTTTTKKLTKDEDMAFHRPSPIEPPMSYNGSYGPSTGYGTSMGYEPLMNYSGSYYPPMSYSTFQGDDYYDDMIGHN